ncbi:hypothetical protein SDC9_61504 [bioreactor metagenome]|uniref:Uncharacterized protein n=1 Tax=bioreactor metagenome TaxID=1076179 RepID=A0A644XH84_9ZZZZ
MERLLQQEAVAESAVEHEKGFCFEMREIRLFCPQLGEKESLGLVEPSFPVCTYQTQDDDACKDENIEKHHRTCQQYCKVAGHLRPPLKR